MPSARMLVALVLGVVASAAACGDEGSSATRPSDAGSPDVTGPGADSPLCEGGKPKGEWPPGPYAMEITSVLPPDLAWEGPSGPVRLKDYYEPCAPRSRLLVVRSAPLWCGTCDWHAKHTARLIGDPRYSDRLRLLDLVLADEDNMPPTLAAASRWRARFDTPPVDSKIAVDAKYMFSAVFPTKSPLPQYVLIDTRTMRVRTVLSNPAPETLLGFFEVELASLDGKPRPDLPSVALHDDLLTDDQFDLLQGMKLPAAPPADPTNEVADLPAAADFGKQLFDDVSLSPSGTVGCVTCHDPQKAFGDGLPQGKGVVVGGRNSPPVALSAHARWQFWDGRADTLWMQALGPFENDKEFASSRLFVVHAIVDRYRASYEAVFGSKYPLPDLTALPPAGKPGDAAYDALSQQTRDGITRVYVNVGKAIAAFERSIRLAPTAFDRYIGGETNALDATQKRALRGFFTVGCAQCHWGPRLTDDAFHAIGFPTGLQDGAADRGRADVLLGLAGAEFIATSKWSDAPAAAKPLAFTSVPPSMIGAFKTPTLRGVARSAPYGHGGTLARLADVTKHYGERGEKVPAGASVGTAEPWLPTFDTNAQAELPSLLEVFTSDALSK